MFINISGKYVHESFPSHYLELKRDGTYFLFEGSSGVSGRYEVHGAEITIVAAGSTSKASIHEGVITDSDGDRWILDRNAVLDTRPPAPTTTAPLPRPGSRSMTDDAPLDSITWLPSFLKQELPWELFEAIAALIVLIAAAIGATHS